MTRLGSSVAGGFMTAVGLFLINIFQANLVVAGTPVPVAWLLVFLVAFALIVFVSHYGKTLRAWTPLRKLIDHRSRFEGFWVENVDVDDRPKALAVIYYSLEERAWIYRGTAFDKKWKPAARWKVRSNSYDQTDKVWLFSGKCQLIDEDLIRSTDRDVYCVMKLPDAPSGNITDVFATDFATHDERPRSFRVQMYRVSDNFLKDKFGGKGRPLIGTIDYGDAVEVIRSLKKDGVIPDLNWKAP